MEDRNSFLKGIGLPCRPHYLHRNAGLISDQYGLRDAANLDAAQACQLVLAEVDSSASTQGCQRSLDLTRGDRTGDVGADSSSIV
jgi:hypothetical protein